MHKKEFLHALGKGLSRLPREEVDERLTFYSELIDDRMEEGCSEEEAVTGIGSVEEIVSQILADASASGPAPKVRRPKRRLTAWEIVLLALGAPIWLSLLIAVFAVAVSLYASLWAVIISLWAVFGALVGCAFGVAIAGIVFICTGYVPTGIAVLGAGLVCGGLAVFAFWGCTAATKGTALLTKKLVLGIGHCFSKKEVA